MSEQGPYRTEPTLTQEELEKIVAECVDEKVQEAFEMDEISEIIDKRMISEFRLRHYNRHRKRKPHRGNFWCPICDHDKIGRVHKCGHCKRKIRLARDKKLAPEE